MIARRPGSPQQAPALLQAVIFPSGSPARKRKKDKHLSKLLAVCHGAILHQSVFLFSWPCLT